MDVSNIRYRDLAQREHDERRRLRERLNQLDRSARSRAGAGVGGKGEAVYYSVEEQVERDRIDTLLGILRSDRGEWCDPLYAATRSLFNGRAGLLSGRLDNPEGDVDVEHEGVALRMTGEAKQPDAASATDCALTLGLLIVDAVVAPAVTADDGFIVTNPDDPMRARMGKAFFNAVGEAQSLSPLSQRVLGILAREGGRTSDNRAAPIVDAAEFARVMRLLAAKGVTENETQLGRRVSEALDRVQLVGTDDVTSEIGIDLPDLEAVSDREIVADNVRLMGPIICAAMLDELKAFQVVDKILESAQNGTLPIGKGPAGKLLYKRWKEAPNRISEPERRNIYAMTMGQPGGDPAIQGNTEFNDLWLRFVSSVSSFVRQQDVDKLLRSSLPSAIGAQQVRKAGRDLASNLSLHGYGMTYYAALELQGEVKSMIELLNDPEILACYASKDLWGVIDQVATMECGGARTSSRYRTLATCGAIITAWLANNVEKVMRPMGGLIDMMDVRSPMPRSAGQKATSTPTDYDLVNACELWLADTAISEARVDEMSQPRESPVMTSKPVPIPAFAREFMDEMPGVGMALNGNGRSNGAARRH